MARDDPPGLDALVVGDVTYTKRRYTGPGHGWVRLVEVGTKMEHPAEVGMGARVLLDRIEELELEVRALREARSAEL